MSLRRFCRMISCAAAKQIRWVNPSMTSVSPSRDVRGDGVVHRHHLAALAVISQLGDALVEHRQRRVDVVVVDHQRRREPQRALPRA